MKRLLFFITGLLLTGALSAQNVNQCEYWFDQDYANHQVVTVVNDSLHWQADASNLSTGLHSLNLHIQDTNGRWFSPRSFMFMHFPTPQSAPATYTYWLDQDSTSSHSGALTNGTMMVDATPLTPGPHVFTPICQIGTDMRVGQYLFYHVPRIPTANADYICWFDQDNSLGWQTGSLVDGTMMVDATALPTGMHQFNIIYRVGNEFQIRGFMFYKIPESLSSSALTFHYRVDGGEFQTASATAQGTLVTLDLDMLELAEGTHTIEHYITNGDNAVLSPLQSDQFVRSHITQYYTLTLLVNDENMGYTVGGGVHADDEPVSFSATAYNGYVFDHWNDNVTTNLREIMLTSDTTFTAYFEIEDGIDEQAFANVHIYAHNGMIYISGIAQQPVAVYDMAGKLLVRQLTTDEGSTLTIPIEESGVYLVTVANTLARKVVVTK